MQNLTRTMHSPERHGPVIEPDPSIGETAVQTRTAPQWNSEKELWEWWYWGSHTCEPHGQWHSTNVNLTKYAISRDGIHWEKPNLGMFELNGSTDNNILTFDGYQPGPIHEMPGRELYHCMRDERDPDPERRYKGLMGVHDRIPAVSPDGFTWTPIEGTQLKSSDESTMTYDPATEQFLAIMKRGTVWGRSMALMTTKDFIEWDDHGIVIHADDIDWSGRKDRIRRVVEDDAYLSPPLVDEEDYISETYNMAIHPMGGGYIGLLNIFDPAGAIPPPHMNHTGLNQIQLAFSRDLLHWRRIGDRREFLGVMPWDGIRYDTQQLLAAGAPVDTDNEIRIYYIAARFRGHKGLYDERLHPYFEQICALSLATLRKDGYISLDASDKQGTLMTCAVKLQGNAVGVNVNAAGGRLRAELIDAETLDVIDRFSADTCTVVDADTTNGRLEWAGVSPASLGDRPVRIRFLAGNCSFYSFWSE